MYSSPKPRFTWRWTKARARGNAFRSDRSKTEIGPEPGPGEVFSTTDFEGFSTQDLDFEPAIRSRQYTSLVEAVEAEGPIDFDGTPEEELKTLLMLAAEVEHGLMIQYLYTVYSTVNSGARRIIRDIAVEEMGHLMTVQNLLISLGHETHFGRYDWNPDPTFAPFPFQLEPLSAAAIAKFAAAEMPEEVDPNEEDILQDILKEATISAGMTPHRVGVLYAKIYWLLRSGDEELADPTEEPWQDFPVKLFAKLYPGRHIASFPADTHLPRQAKHDVWAEQEDDLRLGLVSGRESALRNIASISDQGEGFASTGDSDENDAHFDEFAGVFRTLVSNPPPQAPLAHPVPRIPWYEGNGNPGEEENRITSPDGKRFAALSDSLYEITLLTIRLHLELSRDSNQQFRLGLSKNSIAAMTDGLKDIADLLVGLERHADQSNALDLTCGPPFNRPNVEPGTEPEGLTVRLGDAAEELRQLALNVESTTEISSRRRSAKRVRRKVAEPMIKLLKSQVA